MLKTTDRQSAVLAAVRSLQFSKGSATVRDIGKILGISSPNGVKGHLDRLVESGDIVRQSGKAGGIRLANGPDCRVIPIDGGIVVERWSDDGLIRTLTLYRATEVQTYQDAGQLTDDQVKRIAPKHLDV